MNAIAPVIGAGPGLDPSNEADPGVTVGEIAARLAPGRTWSWVSMWPPDVFAVTGAILADSGAYRCLVNPPAGASWPPAHDNLVDATWEAHIRRCGIEWAATAGAAASPPDDVIRLIGQIESASQAPLRSLDDELCWPTLTAILNLHAMADEASIGVGLDVAATPFLRRAATTLDMTGSLSRLAAERVRVLPKLRAPEAGITLRSLSHHLALDRSEVQARWLVPPEPAMEVGETAGPPSRVTLLLVPHPATVHASDFRPVGGPLANMDERRYGFYEYAPADVISPADVAGLARSARRRLGPIDAVVLPEGAVEEGAVPELQRLLVEEQVPYLIAGVRRSATGGSHFGANYAYIGGANWSAAQPKHHRWSLDAAQVHQYHLGATLDPSVRWWEAIEVQRRTLTFITMPTCGLTVCPMVCEDLARPDPVTDVVRAVAPTLLIALLLDGPQLASRWPARYASVLADDPGCSVLTLTALGMAWRSQPPGTAASRVVALWKDPHRGLQQIELAEGARAIALTAHRREVTATTADGRRNARAISELVLSGLEQIR